MEGSSFVTGVTFDCRSDGSYRDTFFIYTGTLPENCFIEQGVGNGDFCTSPFLKQNYARAEFYDTQKEYRRNMLAKWNVHNEQVLRMMKKLFRSGQLWISKISSRKTSAIFRINPILS